MNKVWFGGKLVDLDADIGATITQFHGVCVLNFHKDDCAYQIGDSFFDVSVLSDYRLKIYDDTNIWYLGEKNKIYADDKEQPEPFEFVDQESDVEWKLGDTVYLSNPDNVDLVYGEDELNKEHECVANLKDEKCLVLRLGFGLGVFNYSMCSKPLTEQQKEDKAKLEAAYDLYCELNANHNIVEFNLFKRNCGNWLRIVEKTGYSVDKEK